MDKVVIELGFRWPGSSHGPDGGFVRDLAGSLGCTTYRDTTELLERRESA